MKKLFAMRKLIVLVSVVFILSFTVLTMVAAESAGIPLPVKNVIFLIGDGMGIGQILVGRNASVGLDGRLVLETLPEVALINTHSLSDNLITDSAAAGTALATGYKTENGMVSVLPDETPVKTLLEAAQERGMATGLISTNTIYDATPATFGAHTKSRSMYEEITAQFLEKQIDVLLGGGKDRFLPSGVDVGKRKDGRNLIEEAEGLGYIYVDNTTALKLAKGDKLLGLFHKSYMNYVLDKDDYGVEFTEPTIAEMTEKAIATLSRNPNGFFLMSEGARIDHAAHAVDVAGVIAEVLAFDEAVKIALDFAKEDGNTLIIVTADHETMGFDISEPLDYDVLSKMKVTPEYMAIKLKKDDNGFFTAESIREVFAEVEYAGITDLSEDEIAVIQAVSDQYSYKVGWEIGSVISARANMGSMSTEVRALSPTGGHTANMVPLFAYGPGAELFSGVLDNTDVARIISTLMGTTLD